MARRREKRGPDSFEPHRDAVEGALPDARDRLNEGRRTPTTLEEAILSSIGLAFAFAILFVMIAVAFIFPVPDIHAKAFAGIMAGTAFAKGAMRCLDALFDIFDEISAHKLVFASIALAVTSGLVAGAMTPETMTPEAAVGVASVIALGGAALPFVIWGALWLWDWIAGVVRPRAARLQEQVRAAPTKAREARAAAADRVSRIPILLRGLALGAVATALGTIAILFLPGVVARQAGELRRAEPAFSPAIARPRPPVEVARGPSVSVQETAPTPATIAGTAQPDATADEAPKRKQKSKRKKRSKQRL